MSKWMFTSESVTEGHPDKVCDQIADAILDELLRQDAMSRCACEVTCEPGRVHIMGEITTTAKVDYEYIAREVIADIGYTRDEYGFNADTAEITVSLHEQSPDIAMGVDRALEANPDDDESIGAGDQGMMFGYACDETASRMPLPIELAHILASRLTEVRKTGLIPYLCPDGKSQVTIEYEDDHPIRLDTVVISAQHNPDVELQKLRSDILEHVIPRKLCDENTKVYINPTGRFVLGGPAADTGLTGRKIIVDTYGGYARHGGGAFSGKDPTKVDRSASYMARYMAKNVVEAGLARRCEIQLGYAIGMARPVSMAVNTFGTGAIPDAEITQMLMTAVSLTPASIIRTLDLRKPVYRRTAAYGHFGTNALGQTWEGIELSRRLGKN